MPKDIHCTLIINPKKKKRKKKDGVHGIGLTDIVSAIALQHLPVKFLLCEYLLPKKMTACTG
jgi:hypothetical protein